MFGGLHYASIFRIEVILSPLASAGGLGKWVTHLSCVLYLEQAGESGDKTAGTGRG